jgi:hypothetical protein
LGLEEGTRVSTWRLLEHLLSEDNQTLTPKLAEIRASVIKGTFNAHQHPNLSQKDAQAQSLGHDTSGWHKCRCKKMS